MPTLDDLAAQNNDAIYLLVRMDATSRLLQRAEDRDVAFESIVIDEINDRFGELGIEAIDCEMTSNAHGSIAHHVRELLPCSPEDDWWLEQRSGARPEPEPVSDGEIEAGAKALWASEHTPYPWNGSSDEFKAEHRRVAALVLAAARSAREGSLTE